MTGRGCAGGLWHGGTACLLILLAMLAAPAVVRAQADAPDPEEYAVWSAVLDSVAPWADAVRVADSAFVLEVAIGQRNDLMMASAMTYRRFDSTAVGDYVARNARGVRIGRFSARRPFGLVKTDLGEDFTLRLKGTHIVFLSRPGFSRDGAKAVISLAMYCGLWCGSGSLYELERGADGSWRVSRMGSGWVS